MTSIAGKERFFTINDCRISPETQLQLEQFSTWVTLGSDVEKNLDEKWWIMKKIFEIHDVLRHQRSYKKVKHVICF